MSTIPVTSDAPPVIAQTTLRVPTALPERIVALDAMRGFAILGILLMNIQGFSMIDAAYMNPTAYGDFEGVNRWVWILSHVLADQKFMALFSVLFGAGVLLFTERAEALGRPSAGLHYRRMFWLFLIGMFHAYTLWYGDVLVAYALCGVVIFLLRKVRPGLLILWGCLALLIPSILFTLVGLSLPFWPPESIAEINVSWAPSPETIAEELEMYRGSWLGQLQHRAIQSFFIQTAGFLVYIGWRSGGLMLIGMALVKWGILTGRKSTAFYLLVTIAGFATGLPLIIMGVLRNFAAGWPLSSMFLGFQLNYWGSLFVAMAYLCGMMLLVRSGALSRIVHGLAAVGRTAFTNYLLQSLICSWIFYGHGLGLFGRVERWQQLVLVLCIWMVEIIFSILWLRRFQYGPLEWLWRSLTYLRFQPLKRQPVVPPGQAG